MFCVCRERVGQENESIIRWIHKYIYLCRKGQRAENCIHVIGLWVEGGRKNFGTVRHGRGGCEAQGTERIRRTGFERMRSKLRPVKRMTRHLCRFLRVVRKARDVDAEIVGRFVFYASLEFLIHNSGYGSPIAWTPANRLRECLWPGIDVLFFPPSRVCGCVCESVCVCT